MQRGHLIVLKAILSGFGLALLPTDLPLALLKVRLVGNEDDLTEWSRIFLNLRNPLVHRNETLTVAHRIHYRGAHCFPIVSNRDRIVLLLPSSIIERDAHGFVDWLARFLIKHAKDEGFAVELHADGLLLGDWGQLVVHVEVSHASLADVGVADHDSLESFAIGDAKQLRASILGSATWSLHWSCKFVSFLIKFI